MEMTTQIFFGKVMHKRLIPKENLFTYGIYYIASPLSKLQEFALDKFRFGVNKSGLMSFKDKDHGPCNGKPLEPWARNILEEYGITQADGDIMLVTMPRVMGYVFNPVSFWLCHDKNESLRAVLCEVHNTFGERHTYLCAHADHRPINRDDILEAQKVFHVSPMLKREGRYTFRFDTHDDKFGVWIDYFNADGDKQLITSLIGKMLPYNEKTYARAFLMYPLVTLKAIMLIHWQAIKILSKGIKYIRRPEQKPERVSATKNLTKI